MPPKRKKKAAKKPARATTRGRRRRTTTWAVAGLAPVALGLAASGGAIGGTPGGAAMGYVPTGNYVVATDSILRVGLDAPEESVPTTWERPRPNLTTYNGCGPYGSADSDSGTNVRKNRTDLPPRYRAVTFEAITNLDWPRGAKPRRDRWSRAQLDSIAPYEGLAVTVTGFVVALRPQARSGESPNCGQKGEANTDWHIALVGEFGDPESLAVVVEPTPRIKQHHPNWTPDALKPFVGTADSVRFSGYLLLDPVHKGHLGKYRQTLWEVHPVHRMEVFRQGAWVDLDSP